MRKVAKLPGAKWTTPLPPELSAEWNTYIREMVLAEPLVISRCVKPEGALGPPEMIISMDGSLIAYCGTAHLRYEVEESKPGPWSTAMGKRKG